MRKVIGLVPLYDEERSSYWMLPGYMQAVEACGGVPVMLPLTTDPEELRDCFALCQGLLLTGGQDVDPALYREEPRKECGAPCPARDEMERLLFSWALEADKPVLGICRGLQLMNVLLGGSLYQDLPTQHPSGVEHYRKPPLEPAAHQVTVLEKTGLAALIGSGVHRVNSYHHQAVCRLGEGARAMALSEDGLVEALCVPEKKFVWGVQWHPERAYLQDPCCKKLVQAFVDAAEAWDRA